MKLIWENRYLIIALITFFAVYFLPIDVGDNVVKVSDGRGLVYKGSLLIVDENGFVKTENGKYVVTEDGHKLLVGGKVKERTFSYNKEIFRAVITDDGRYIITDDGRKVFEHKNKIITQDFKKVLVNGEEIGVTKKALLTKNGKVTIAIMLMALVLFLTEGIPLPAVAFLIGIFQVFFMKASPNDVAKSFFNDSVFFIMGSLMIARAFVKQGLDKKIALMLLKRTGTKVSSVVLGIVASTSILAAFIADHTVAAMFLPIGIALTVNSGEGLRRLGKLLMFAIAYGCAIGGPGTPSGGARNVIVIEYWKELFGLNIGYKEWMIFSFPFTLIMIPITAKVLNMVFKPEINDLSRAMDKIKSEIGDVSLTRNQKLAVGLFIFIIILWITLGTKYGLGTIAITGSILYLIFRLAEWKDYNRIDWGVVLLYAGAMSLGLAMINTGAARWIAENVLTILSTVGMASQLGLSIAVALLVGAMTNTMSNAAAVAVTGPIALNMAYLSNMSVVAIGLVTAMSSAFAYLLVIGTPPNTIVYSSGYLRPSDYLKAGAIMFVISLIVMIVLMEIWWPIATRIAGVM